MSAPRLSGCDVCDGTMTVDDARAKPEARTCSAHFLDVLLPIAEELRKPRAENFPTRYYEEAP